MTLVSWALGCRTYSSAPLSRINCTVNAPYSPRPCSVHEACTSVTWRTLIVCSVCCSATYSPFFRAIDYYSVRPFVPAAEGFKPPAALLYFRVRDLARTVEVLVVEAHRVLDGVPGVLGVGEVAHGYFLAFEHLVVLEEALEFRQPVLRELAVLAVGVVLGVVEVDADYLLVVLAFIHHMHHPDRTRPQDAERLDRLLHQHQHVERVVVIPQGLRDKAVVGRVDHGRKLLGSVLPDRNVVPGMGHFINSFRNQLVSTLRPSGSACQHGGSAALSALQLVSFLFLLKC